MQSLPLYKRITLSRSLTSYDRVRRFIGASIRNKPIQFRWVRKTGYLNAGCGPNIASGFMNLDYYWRPGILCWDVTQELPFENSSLQGVYSEHCLEHLSYEDAGKALREFGRVLMPNGRLRIVVPDAELYINLYVKSRSGEKVVIPYEEELPIRTPLFALNHIMRDHGHLYAYDFEAMKELIKQAGFKSITRTAFGSGEDPSLLIDTPTRACESLYVEALA
jgi:predicted SAM-dependent methyltransferase